MAGVVSNFREHDKGPSEFAEVVLKLKDRGFRFKLSLLGNQSGDIPGTHVAWTLNVHVAWTLNGSSVCWLLSTLS